MATPSVVDQMASWLSRLSLVPAFPEYTGPYKVGSIDVEIPISQLTSPSPAPDGAEDIHTIQFRAFYPATPGSDGQPITWLPAPQRLHLSFYTQFLGLGALAANIVSFLPRHLHRVTIPVHKNATLLPPGTVPGQSRWPTVVFSHGLGGSRNAYSHLAGSLASHGIVVICPEHRDGSSIVSLARSTESTLFLKYPSRVFPCIRIPHTNTPEVWAARDKQMRIRLWELGLNLEAILAIDNAGFHVLKYNMNESTPESAISQFSGKLDVQEPGKIIFGGHSFGAATVVQLHKCTYYAGKRELSQMPNPLFTPSEGSAVRRQITEHTPTFLLDMWCFQLLSAATEPLFNLPLPAYDDIPGAPGGNAILAIESDGFYKWKDHLHSKARILSPDPTQKVVSAESFISSTGPVNKPHFFYVRDSAHLNQSDFGLLFPWLTKKIFGGDNPERVMRLNVRALLQFFRENGVSGVAKTGAKDLVEGGVSLADNNGGIDDDKAILSKNGDGGSDVQGWVPINIVVLGAEAGPNERELVGGQVPSIKVKEAEQGEEKMEDEIEPSLVKHDEAEVASAVVVNGLESKHASEEIIEDKVESGLVGHDEPKVAPEVVINKVDSKHASEETLQDEIEPSHVEHDKAKVAPTVVINGVEPKSVSKEVTEDKIEHDLAKDKVKVAIVTVETVEDGIDTDLVKNDEPKVASAGVIGGTKYKSPSVENAVGAVGAEAA